MLQRYATWRSAKLLTRNISRMTFNEESLRKGIQFGLGSQGIWTPELENKMFEEIKSQALSQDAVMKSVCCCVNWHPPIKADEGKKAVCSNCKRPRHTVV